MQTFTYCGLSLFSSATSPRFYCDETRFYRDERLDVSIENRLLSSSFIYSLLTDKGSKFSVETMPPRGPSEGWFGLAIVCPADPAEDKLLAFDGIEFLKLGYLLTAPYASTV